MLAKAAQQVHCFLSEFTPEGCGILKHAGTLEVHPG
jgi:hypothetical protein